MISKQIRFTNVCNKYIALYISKRKYDVIVNCSLKL